MKQKWNILKNLLIKSLSFVCLFTFAFSSYAEVAPASLSEQTLARFKKVPEFEFIIQEANKLGVKVYLFGGTASAFAHYVRWDLEREAGDDKYQAERFDYDFTNIYRGNQDLDIVVDGSPEQADQLKAILEEAYPHFVGDREAWEVRLLRESRGDKRALIGDEDFKKQHSDTNSTGMLLLNPDPRGIVYNDLLNWGSAESDFLNDVASARIKFLFGEEHEETQRFKDDLNPPVLAAIRYLAKLAQYEVEGTTGDWGIIKKIIQKTDFTKLSGYAKKKAEEFALKTLLNAPDSEYAWNLLEKSGARRKLIKMDGERLQVEETLSWWMNKEPLRSSSFKEKGKTARAIFGTEEIIVSHETNSFKAYENITRSSKGGANAFISRQGVTGEAAQFGNGFYTKLGLEGAVGTGLTIRFKLHPDAREGVDFIKEGNYIIVQNKKALTLIQENLNLNITDILKLIRFDNMNRKDKGFLHKMVRKFKRGNNRFDLFKESLLFIREEAVEFEYPHIKLDFLDESLFHENLTENLINQLFASYAALPQDSTQFFIFLIESYDINKISKVFPSLIEEIIKIDHMETQKRVSLALFEKLDEETFPQFEKGIKTVIVALTESYLEGVQKKVHELVTVYALEIVEKFLLESEDLLLSILNIVSKYNGDYAQISMLLYFLENIFPKMEVSPNIKKKFEEIVLSNINQSKRTFPKLEELFSQPYMKQYPDLLELLISKEPENERVISSILSQNIWSDWEVLNKSIIFIFNNIKKINNNQSNFLIGKINELFISKDEDKFHDIIDHFVQVSDRYYVAKIFSNQKLWKYPKYFFLRNLMNADTYFSLNKMNLNSPESPFVYNKEILVELFTHEEWKNLQHSQDLQKKISDYPDNYIFSSVELNKIFLNYYWSMDAELFSFFVEQTSDTSLLAEEIAKERWAGNIEVLNLFINKSYDFDEAGLRLILSQPHWNQHPDFMAFKKDPEKMRAELQGKRRFFNDRIITVILSESSIKNFCSGFL